MQVASLQLFRICKIIFNRYYMLGVYRKNILMSSLLHKSQIPPFSYLDIELFRLEQSYFEDIETVSFLAGT